MEATGQPHAPASLPTGRESAVSIGWVDPTAILDILEKWKISCPYLIQTLDHQSHGLVTIPTVLSMLLMYVHK